MNFSRVRHENWLVDRLPHEERQFVSQHLVRCDLPKGTLISEPDVDIEHVFFLQSGVASVISRSANGSEAESGLYGREGFGPVAAVLGAKQAAQVTVLQVAGTALRIERVALLELVEARPVLRGLLLRFVQALVVQTGFTALSNAVHSVNERLARWLLMCHDRHDSDDLPLTHEFLSLMLAVRRPSVTTALHVLEGHRFIAAERGYVTIRDRRRMEEFAGDAYGRPEEEYRRLIA